MMVLNHNHLCEVQYLFSSFFRCLLAFDISLMLCSTSMFSWDSECLPSHHMIVVYIWLIIWWPLMWSSFDRYSITHWLDVSIVSKRWLIKHMMSIDVWLTTWWPLMCPVDTIDNLMAGYWYMINEVGHWCIHLIWSLTWWPSVYLSLPTWWHDLSIGYGQQLDDYSCIHMMNQQYGGPWCFCFDLIHNLMVINAYILMVINECSDW